ncbi:oligosaccharide flippase family protein [Bacillus coahuilensis]|uniref:oligosaccharide flippase family protein n=1 Tax=Bacillus coahuilensis TaxID=408580 RepID=UPI00138A3D11|nr:oligosaccharide flippase family protein [Bacillus coahuilensis]
MLGIEAYSLITYFITMQIVLNLLSVGLSKTLRKEFASGGDSDGEKSRKYKLLKSAEFIYIIIAVLIIGACFLASDYIAYNWLNIHSINKDTVSLTIKLMGASIAIQLLANLFSGCLFGLEYQVKANVFQVCWSAAKSIGVIGVLIYVSNDIRAFYIWYLAIDIIYYMVLRRTVIKYLKSDEILDWNIKDLVVLKSVWRYAIGLGIIAIGYTINTQVDKIIISKHLPLTAGGAYNTTFTLATLTTFIPTAIGTAAFSRFAYYNSVGLYVKQKELFYRINKFSSICITAMAAYIAVFAFELLYVWTGSSEIAELMGYAAFFFGDWILTKCNPTNSI